MVLPFRRKNTPVEGEQVPDDSEILEIVDQIEEELTANRMLNKKRLNQTMTLN